MAVDKRRCEPRRRFSDVSGQLPVARLESVGLSRRESGHSRGRRVDVIWNCSASLKRPALTGRYGGAATPLALGIALIWLVHPLQTQSVTYLVQRFESLMGLCFFLTLYFFVRGVDSPRPRSWFAAAVGHACWAPAAKRRSPWRLLIVLWYDRGLLRRVGVRSGNSGGGSMQPCWPPASCRQWWCWPICRGTPSPAFFPGPL